MFESWSKRVGLHHVGESSIIQTPIESSMWAIFEVISSIIFDVLLNDESSRLAKTVAFAVLMIALLAAMWIVFEILAFYDEF